MDLELDGRVAMISGASRGIGRAIALGLAKEGCRLSLCARNGEALEAVARDAGALGVDVLAVTADVSASADTERWVNQTRDRFGRIDVLINNVGGSRGPTNLSASKEDWQNVLGLNLLPAVELSRLVVPLMREQGRGCIIHMSSIYGREWGGPMSYNASKAAVISLSKQMARELAPHGIRVNSVAPGSTMFPGGSWERKQRENPEAITAFVKAELPFGRFGTAEEVADAVIFLASARASWISGACLNVDGCQSRSLF
jgi:3-oxoacyl-[acyl-carrier protein] reductase